MEDTIAISIQGLARRFGDLTALHPLNLEIASGEIFGLVGPDGAGKTTTLRLLCGLLEPSGGMATVAGFDIAGETASIHDRIGYMPQRFGLYPDLTVSENMIFYADLFGLSGSELRELSQKLLRMTRLEPFAGRQAGKLSGGMKQKLALMCALLHKPRVLFLDEPTNGVDPVSRRDFWKILYELVKERITVVITTAYLDEAERCNRVGLMYGGRLIECDSPEGLVDSLEEKCLRIECAQARRAKQLLTNQPGVVSVESSGAALHLFLAPSHSPERLEAILQREGLAPVRIEPIRPSLEDVFIALVRKRGLESSETREVAS